jgi:hypothetical protein
MESAFEDLQQHSLFIEAAQLIDNAKDFGFVVAC